jgi:hypothetical protein
MKKEEPHLFRPPQGIGAFKPEFVDKTAPEDVPDQNKFEYYRQMREKRILDKWQKALESFGVDAQTFYHN